MLDDAPLGGPFSLTEGRVLYELAHRNAPAANELCRDLALDRGYLSRILARFQKQGLVERSRSASDGRQSHIRLTREGRNDLRRDRPCLAGRDGGVDCAADRAEPPRARFSDAANPSASRRRGRRKRPNRRSSTFASTGSATWAGSCSATLSSTARNLAGTTSSRRWWPRSARSSSATTIRRASGAGSPTRGGAAGRLGVSGQGQRRDRQAAPALRRAERARPRRRTKAGRRLRRARARGRLPKDHALDERRARLRPPHLSGGRLPPREGMAGPKFGKDLVGQDWDLEL